MVTAAMTATEGGLHEGGRVLMIRRIGMTRLSIAVMHFGSMHRIRHAVNDADLASPAEKQRKPAFANRFDISRALCQGRD